MAMPTTRNARYHQPMNVEQIAKKAQEYDYNPRVPLRRWLRTAQSLVREAAIYEEEGNDEQAYLLLFRHAQLVLVNLAAHPEAREPSSKKALVEAEKEVKTNLAKLEKLKPAINKKFEWYQKNVKERDAKRRAISHSRTGSSSSVQILDPALAGATQTIEAEENKELAVQLAQKEFSRRATVRKATRQAGIPEDEEQRRRTAGVWGDWEAELRRDSAGDGVEFDQKLRQVGSILDGKPDSGRPFSQPRYIGSSSSSGSYKYPSVPQNQGAASYGFRTPDISSGSLVTPPPKIPIIPPLPPKDPQHTFPSYASPPPIPGKVPSTSLTQDLSRPPPLPSKITSTPSTDGPPSSTTDLKPSTYTFKPSAYLENGSPLRTLFLPSTLRTTFLHHAASNTRSNLETCGILCGTLMSNALFISRLVIPDQTSTPDTCETVNESALFDYCDKEDLLVLGWIHTHPTQTCFMSSRDLHTHSGYQVMLPESIAIVCAPSKKPDWGVFRMTDPPGLKRVLNCSHSGLFHPHDESGGGLYTDAMRPGHVVETAGLEFEVADLRPGK